MTPFPSHVVAVGGVPTTYRVYVPPNVREGDAIPAILFLHGAGESGSDGLLPTKVGIGPAILRDPERFPALVVFPQASRGYGWRGFNLAAAVAALDDVERRHAVDRERVSVTGISMGGYGAWLAALQQPETFAAVVPVCGGLDRTTAVEMKILPNAPLLRSLEEAATRIAPIAQWVFHGEADDIIPVEQSRVMVRALRAAGAEVRYTEYPGVRHNSWDRAYAEPELMPWLLRQRRNVNPPPRRDDTPR
ncbi:MAG TPA: prolyl oligopeptidase family serine peptidase [Thermoanaerobaculia bacterium]|nr:prolyl oligopeptidase family serine peptidase [Thermoanaerobaculia bacterium]